MSLNTYDKTTGKLIPAAGIPYETLNSKVNNTVISPSSTAEATTTATKAHTTGDYFELNEAFVKAKTDIAIGDTLVEGTNIESTNVGSELGSVLSLISSLDSRLSPLEEIVSNNLEEGEF